AATGETVPEPIAGRSYSGKFMVRVPPDVHRKLAVQAAESGISLNPIPIPVTIPLTRQIFPASRKPAFV
ncbi:MAG: type II toxin-antitoxin system HicB family antitoxin, partial [bacterium]|nr:type II toxin-antitoxin system HicB family antitoxin [bacterium]